MTNLITTLTQEAPEQGTFAITAAYFDDAGTPVVPTAATWTLTDILGVIINSRDSIAITGLSTTSMIVLTGNDLAIGEHGYVRRLLVEYVYNSSLGNGLAGKAQVNFRITDFLAVP